jgi:hypothetical protein
MVAHESADLAVINTIEWRIAIADFFPMPSQGKFTAPRPR